MELHDKTPKMINLLGLCFFVISKMKGQLDNLTNIRFEWISSQLHKSQEIYMNIIPKNLSKTDVVPSWTLKTVTVSCLNTITNLFVSISSSIWMSTSPNLDRISPKTLKWFSKWEYITNFTSSTPFTSIIGIALWRWRCETKPWKSWNQRRTDIYTYSDQGENQQDHDTEREEWF